ncbi:MAG: acetyl-CoA carboxylase, carboxyltransferase subunit beta [Candidatus Obscuribacterales bacterium]|nr:acetyl-CoA carboxylase, carboxyltransferase subunit beta [Candidatus Obscuribacterales bacterium]
MDLKEWFANRKKKQESVEVKQPLSTEEYCALWTQCHLCRELLYTRDLRQNLHVCPKCQYHFRIGAEQRIEQLADPDSFVELDANLASADPLGFVDSEPYAKRLKDASRKSGLRESVVTGTITLNQTPIAVGVMDFGHFGGSMGSVVGEKVARLIEEAQKRRVPLIIISSSGGARMQEGILSLMQLAKTSAALQAFHEEGLLYISILTEPTYGGVTASFAMLGDIIIAEPGARVGFAGRRVIEQTIRQKLPADFQTAEYLLSHGQVDMVVERARLRETLSQIIEFHKGNNPTPLSPSNGKKGEAIYSR